ncbi:MAG: hypothetical protein IPM29_05850 [Planctomycetes bacterium]|nr:hypothetical protein [Planctomycetota bacterium]
MPIVLALAALTAAAAPSPADLARPQEPPTFATPIRLLADGKPLGQRLPYPSPRRYDIDGDGETELVIGDLPGRVQVADKLGDDPATWSALRPFETDGRPLKFHNW